VNLFIQFQTLISQSISSKEIDVSTLLFVLVYKAHGYTNNHEPRSNKMITISSKKSLLHFLSHLHHCLYTCMCKGKSNFRSPSSTSSIQFIIIIIIISSYHIFFYLVKIYDELRDSLFGAACENWKLNCTTPLPSIDCQWC